MRQRAGICYPSNPHTRQISLKEGGHKGALPCTERLVGIGLLAAGIAHEINNPLGSARLAAETAVLLRNDPGTGEELAACLENIVASMDRCGRIVRALLRYCRDEPPEKISCSINDVVQQAADVTRPYAERQMAVLRLECDPKVPLAPMNPLEIEIVLVNLIRNALAASGTGGEVLIRTTRTNGVVRTVVHDNGRGMSRRQLTHAFDPLYTTQKSAGGCGLGLSIAREIIDRHQGFIKVTSREGGGSVVTVDLPITVNGRSISIDFRKG